MYVCGSGCGSADQQITSSSSTHPAGGRARRGRGSTCFACKYWVMDPSIMDRWMDGWCAARVRAASRRMDAGAIPRGTWWPREYYVVSASQPAARSEARSTYVRTHRPLAIGTWCQKPGRFVTATAAQAANANSVWGRCSTCYWYLDRGPTARCSPFRRRRRRRRRLKSVASAGFPACRGAGRISIGLARNRQQLTSIGQRHSSRCHARGDMRALALGARIILPSRSSWCVRTASY